MSGSRATILTYHNIDYPPKGYGLRSLYVLPIMFRFQMWYLKLAGFKVVPLDKIYEYSKGNFPGKKLVALTFDDGYDDFYQLAYPILKSYHYPATVFLVSELVGKENQWDFDKMSIRKKLMDWQTIKTLQKDGITFEAHSCTHPHLDQLPKEQILREVMDSKKKIENELQSPVYYFCYPFGDYNQLVMEQVKNAGFKAGLTMQSGFVAPKDNPFEWKRVKIKFNTHPITFLAKLHTNYECKNGK